MPTSADAPTQAQTLARGLADAESAAARAGVVVRSLHDVEAMAGARALFDRVWPVVGGGTNLTSNLARAVEHAGGYLAAAYDLGRDVDVPVAAGFGVLGRTVDADGQVTPTLHSHMLAALDAYRDRHVGTAVKLHQRAWALRHGIPVVTWTFDPLVRRNVRFNLLKLGADVTEYLVDFYGRMDDEVNHGDPSDRLMAWWDVASPRAVAAAAGELRPMEAWPEDAVVVPLPADVVALRRADPQAARVWRLRVRESVTAAFSEGLRPVGVTTDGAMVLRRPDPGEDA